MGVAAAPDDTIWSADNRVYVGGFVLVGVIVLANAWLLSRRPTAGALVALAAAMLLLGDIGLFPITTFRAHVVFWFPVAVPLLLASGLGLWRAHTQRRDPHPRRQVA
jgi:CHASE2 domain-containing sensor protein